MKMSLQFTKSYERGYALISTLVCLMVCGLIIAALLGYANTTLRARASLERNIKGLYDADAGIEHVIWCLGSGATPATNLPQTVNNNDVLMEIQDMGERCMYAGEWITLGSHSDWLLIDGNLIYDEFEEAYKYTITVTWNGQSTIHIAEVGARLPVDYTYQEESAAIFVDNLSTDEPDKDTDFDGAQLVNWVLPPPRPSVNEDDPIKTQEFYITGEGDLTGHYAWVVAARTDIGYISELSGTFYVVTATATCPEDSEIVARIEANIMISAGNTYIISWQIIPD